MKYYSNWRATTFSCRNCGWSALGSEFSQGEVYNELVGRDCPKCHSESFVIELPTPEEILAAGERADPVDILQAKIILAANGKVSQWRKS
jgi:hypothetical protein